MTHPAPITWTIRADRRTVDHAHITGELLALGETIKGLDVHLLEGYEDAPDGGAFRDFISVARATARDERLLEALVMELVMEFGYAVDVARGG